MVFGMFGARGVDISIALDRADGTYAIGDTVVSYLVVGTIDRLMRGNDTVTQWVSLHNG